MAAPPCSPGYQEKLMEAITSTGKPVIVIYIQGRPLNMNLAAKKAQALLTAWYPGEQGGAAIADVLFGDYNPAGRLPVSIPRSDNSSFPRVKVTCLLSPFFKKIRRNPFNRIGACDTEATLSQM